MFLAIRPFPRRGAYRFAPDPISKRKRKKIAENPQDKPLRAIVRFAILGVSPSDILGFAFLTFEFAPITVR